VLLLEQKTKFIVVFDSVFIGNAFHTWYLHSIALRFSGCFIQKNDGLIPGCVNADGTAQKEAIPAEWGQAAFISALVEDLAGVVDKGVQYSSVKISPRWYFAGIEKTSVNIGYGNDGSQVAYTYSFNPKNNHAEIVTTGKFDNFTVRIPLPEKSKTASATINGKKVQVITEQINQSRYAVVKGTGNSNIGSA
jgi:hypothetical protein